MIISPADNRNSRSLASRMRRQRMNLFFGLIESLPEPVRVLDVGGTAGLWKHNISSTKKQLQITFLNLEKVPVEGLPYAESVIGNACDMKQFPDKSFDICFSNSTIEHVGSFDAQFQASSEMRRVAHTYFIQTPNFFFPLEPHFLIPGWQWLPVPLRVSMHRSFNLGWMPRQPNPTLAAAAVRNTRLLSLKEFKQLFPDATIHHEKIGPLTKSFIAIKNGGS